MKTRCAAISLLLAILAAFTAVAQPSNDQCAGALVITGAEFTHTESTDTATSTGDPSPSCVNNFGNGVWFQYTAPASGGDLEIDTAGSTDDSGDEFDTGLAVYTGGCGSLTEVNCNDDDLQNGLLTSRIDMALDGGVNYWFLAGGSGGATGNLVFHLAFTANGPPVITSQPVNQSVAVSSNATFSLTASSLTPLSYSWEMNSAPIAGATNSSYTLANAPLSESGTQFSCLVSNANGAVLSSNATLFVSQPAVLYDFNFESGLQGFTVNNTYTNSSSYTNGLWHLSTGRANDPGHSPTHSLYYGHDETTNGGGNYDTGNLANAGVVISPPLNLSGGPITLSFSYLMNVEPVHNYPADLTYVEVSTNDGASYTIVDAKGAGLTNDTDGVWVTNVTDLSAFAATNVWLRFRFDTVDQLFNSTEGWYIDDIRITGLGSPPPLLQGVAQTNGQLLFSWTPISGEGYQVQFKTNLSQTNWVDLGPPITNGVVPATNAIGPDPQRFYRLQVVP